MCKLAYETSFNIWWTSTFVICFVSVGFSVNFIMINLGFPIVWFIQFVHVTTTKLDKIFSNN